MNRREILGLLGAAALSGARPPAARAARQNGAAEKTDITLRIGPVTVEVAPKKSFQTIGYNGMAPGPLLRMREGKAISFGVYNDTGEREVIHWHGLHVPSEVDGSVEEGTPVVPPHGYRRYDFTPTPSGTRWYHSHMMAGRNLKRGTYTGQFGFLYIEPASEPGNYDQEMFLALREWDPFLSTGGEDEGNLDVAYKLFSINGRALGHGDPIRVKEGQRVLFRILNASATQHRRIAFAGHSFQVTALDGNALQAPKTAEALELGPAERIDAIVEMNQPGVWILGTTNDRDRAAGMGIVIEYAGRTDDPRWTTPSAAPWDYRIFGSPVAVTEAAERIPLVFQKKFAGNRWVDNWTINGKSYPKTDRMRVKAGQRYRLIFDNRSDEAHPVHLHRHTFELTKILGLPTSGVRKDVAVVGARSQMEVDFIAGNPGLTLFHCHQQMHMDYGFMALMEYV